MDRVDWARVPTPRPRRPRRDGGRYELTLEAGPSQPTLPKIDLGPVTTDRNGFIDLAKVKLHDMPAGGWYLFANPVQGPAAETVLRVRPNTCLKYEWTGATRQVKLATFDGSGTMPNSEARVSIEGTITGATSDQNGSYVIPVTGTYSCGQTITGMNLLSYPFLYSPRPWTLTLTCPTVARAAEPSGAKAGTHHNAILVPGQVMRAGGQTRR